MSRLQLTDQAVAAAKGKDRHLEVLWDTDLYGFGCRVSPEGPATYFVYYRTKSADRRVVKDIASAGAVSCEQARRIASDLIGRNAPRQFARRAVN
ncbi:Arm DNA-binding domain-containing protein [Ferruginivarius sediminum]|uniref:DUF4102 domain-containing protein n=1 Tax=Ferruginivarius sediminum TaxID=2661937 RepID=A0A369TDL8_9PROT|nr:Arm DNA-binding domain-containing protein [Ferruginivarius sediminum]RDD61016.1 DUF4102 domain-containing protein [Ferruginivarius sediminum]